MFGCFTNVDSEGTTWFLTVTLFFFLHMCVTFGTVKIGNDERYVDDFFSLELINSIDVPSV